jgi:DNA-binding response OmpR family regulator
VVAEKKVIVVVDDDQRISELIKVVLESEPEYEAVVVNDSRHALEVILSVPTRLILLDVRMPGIDGIQLDMILQASRVTRAIPVIFMTANGQTLGFNRHKIGNYIAKPFDPDELVERVDAAVRSG